MIGILDLNMGNIRSVFNAVYQNGFDPVVVDSPDCLDDLSHLIVPGVGNFGAAVPELDRRNLRKGVIDFAISKRPILGTCLGMQLLMELGSEGGKSNGLGLIPGRVERLHTHENLRIPHVGWNILNLTRPHPVFTGIKTMCDFYFVHSYEVICSDNVHVIGETDYGHPVAAVIGKENVIGVQFHPEKSQVNGMRVIENFCLWDGRC
ncbi:imidazole glycerol phosphate synthase subunit HisH [Thalassospira lucentensis]|uniref:Imidazole glycerol phosphate synthase subunit HisH n=2 Tax=Thalassospira TaxID=168934 RepID=A0A285T5R1_9PROT|nr:imidazole glycerol phosphate synthase subunit HisH [Thalassospira lucentensis]SOC16711.1 imidazole glycerol phosphate synthase subunit hisH [Thalassospira xiamenensis]